MMPTLLAQLAEVGALEGDQELYNRVGSQALELGWRSGARKALAQAIRARGMASSADGRWEDAEADLHNALNRYVDLGTRWDEARTHAALAALARRRGGPDDASMAREELQRAQQLFEAMGAARDTAHVRAALAGGEVRLL